MKRTSSLSYLKTALVAHHRVCLNVGQACLIAVSLTTAFLLRFDLTLPDSELDGLAYGIAMAIPAKMAVFIFAGLNRGWLRYASLPDLYRLVTANVLASALFTLVVRVAIGPSFPRSVYLIDLLLCFVVMSGLRFAVRLYNEIIVPELPKSGRKRLLIYGAGTAGIALYRELRATPSLGYDVVGFVDDDSTKRNVSFLGTPVVCSGRSLVHVQGRNGHKRIDEIIIAMPSATGREMREAVANCRAAGIRAKPYRVLRSG